MVPAYPAFFLIRCWHPFPMLTGRCRGGKMALLIVAGESTHTYKRNYFTQQLFAMQIRSTLVPMLLAVLITTSTPAPAQTHKKPTAGELQADMRQLWEDHITWTRNVILNILDGLPGTNAAVGRLLQNQADIGEAIKPFYGAAAGNQLAALLHDHITIAASLLTALKTGNTTAFTEANTQWVANADDIASFLSGANPAWPLTEMKSMMREHLELTAKEALARKNADYPGDVAAYEAVHKAILEMADMLAAGIVAQFPSRFAGGCPAGPMQGNHTTMRKPTLQQNAPNPAADKTIIAYYLPEGVKEAHMVISDERGQISRRVLLPARGEGQLTFVASGLQRGLYTYSLIADGQVADTKKLLLH